MMPRSTGIARRIVPRALREYLRRQLPMNLRDRDSSLATIETEVAYAVGAGETYLNLLTSVGVDPNGKVILEIGPGTNFGGAMVLACHGAQLIVADRFLADWSPSYHPKFYNLLRGLLAADDPFADLSPLDRLVERNGYADSEIRRVHHSAEELREIPDGSVDIVLSNAVFEHLFDMPAACSELARISKPCAWGFHQVDFRDHRDYTRPLEYLLLGEEKFRRLFAWRHGECGSQWRPWEMARAFEEAGFEVLRFETSMTAEENYLRKFEPRLRKSSSRYRHTPISDLAAIGGRFHLRRQLRGPREN